MITSNTRKLYFVIYVIMIASLSSCKKAVPTITNLKSLSGFFLDSGSAAANSKATPSFSLSGRCAKFSDVEISFNKGASWKKLSSVSSPSAIGCVNSTGNFSATVNATTSDFPISLSTVNSYEIYLRGTSEIGFSDYAILVLNFSTDQKRGAITAGTAGKPMSSSSGNYIMSGRLVSYSKNGQSVNSASGAYRLKGVLKR